VLHRREVRPAGKPLLGFCLFYRKITVHLLLEPMQSFRFPRMSNDQVLTSLIGPSRKSAIFPTGSYLCPFILTMTGLLRLECERSSLQPCCQRATSMSSLLYLYVPVYGSVGTWCRRQNSDYATRSPAFVGRWIAEARGQTTRNV
jgi:hypothetical protein